MKTLRRLVLLFFCFSFSTGLLASPGDLDPTFGPVGFIATSLSSGTDRAYAVARQPDGKIVAAGIRNGGANMAIVRYNPDGSLDSSFDGDGVVTIFSGNFNNEARAIAIQPDGKIVLAGTSVNGGNSLFTVVRLNSNGTLDTFFDGDGIFTESPGVAGLPNAIAIQNDGKIVTAGTIIVNFFFSDFSIVRLNTNGSYDTSFNGNGRTTVSIGTPASGSEDAATAVAIQPDGKIVAGGYSPFVTARDFSLARLNSDGSLDNSFDGDGRVQTTFGGSGQNEAINGIAIDGTGKIVAAGVASDGSVRGFAIARYNTNGSLDTTFSDDGRVITDMSGNGNSVGKGVAVQTDGKIVAVGYGISQIAIVRHNTDGSLDSTFSGDGKAFMSVYGSFATARGVVAAPNGELVLAGYAAKIGAIDEDFVFARFNSDGTPSTDLGVFGYVLTNPFNETSRSSSARSGVVQPDGKIVVGGNIIISSSESVGMIARYLSDGILDTSFASSSSSGQGIATVRVPGGIGTQELAGLAIQPDGKICATGTYETQSDAGLFVARFNSDGSVDTSFGGMNSGFKTISAIDGGGPGQDITVLPDGKILVAGATANIATQLVKFAVFKLNANGSVDTSFGSNGIATTSFSSSNDVAFSLAAQTDGKIVAVGASDFDLGSNSQIALARFNTSGTIDTSFGTGGKVTTEVGGFTDLAADIQLQADGKIVIGGVSCTDANCVGGNGLIFRYLLNGSLDPSFDNDGKVFVQPTISGSATSIFAIAIQPDSKIIGSGSVINPGTQSDVLIARYSSDGAPDSTFGANGIVSTDIGSSNQEGNSVSLQSDGKIVAVGSSAVGTRDDVAVFRYLGNQPQSLRRSPFDFDGDGKTDVGIFRPGAPNGAEWWYQRSSNSQVAAVQFGTSTDKIVPGDFTGDGKADIAFFRPSDGHWFVLRSEDSSFFAFPWGSSGDIPAPADYDGDGRTDPAVFRPSATTWFISNSGGGTSFVTFGISTDKPVMADYDGDAKADIAIWRAGPGEWWGRRSTNGSVFAVQFGTTSDRPVQGDYTGDGKADIAFWRPTDGNWFILRSEDSSFLAFPFGSSGDTPVPGDYDGDGRTDSAVFRPSNATWFLNRSTAGVAIQQFGLTTDTPIPSAFVP
ncbi:MAG: FG-GAP-like repeat-containing protein [Pyrinomonadaceae bacterium]